MSFKIYAHEALILTVLYIMEPKIKKKLISDRNKRE